MGDLLEHLFWGILGGIIGGIVGLVIGIIILNELFATLPILGGAVAGFIGGSVAKNQFSRVPRIAWVALVTFGFCFGITWICAIGDATGFHMFYEFWHEEIISIRTTTFVPIAVGLVTTTIVVIASFIYGRITKA